MHNTAVSQLFVTVDVLVTVSVAVTVAVTTGMEDDKSWQEQLLVSHRVVVTPFDVDGDGDCGGQVNDEEEGEDELVAIELEGQTKNI